MKVSVSISPHFATEIVFANIENRIRYKASQKIYIKKYNISYNAPVNKKGALLCGR